MCNTLELSGLFVCLRRLIRFFSAWGDSKKILGCGVLGGISTHADTMSKFWKNEKKPDILSLYTSVTWMKFIRCMVPENGARLKELLAILGILPHPIKTRKNQSFEKMKEKKTWRYLHFTQVNQKSWSYAILFLRYGTWQM